MVTIMPSVKDLAESVPDKVIFKVFAEHQLPLLNRFLDQHEPQVRAKFEPTETGLNGAQFGLP